jgi:hypothetical protein
MATKIFEVFGEVTLDNKKLNQGLDNVKNKLKVVSTAILALGVGAVKLASDFEETSSKFTRAFKGIEDQAEKTAKVLQDSYGLSELESKRLLSSTGDLLKGFGATTEQALDLSNQVQQLSADLASYNPNIRNTAQASEILTKAMLGERDALVSLGLKISEADVQQRLLEKGQKDLTGQALLLAKSQATLEIALSQSGDALGDFSRTSGSLKNQLNILKGDVTDLAVEFGQQLLPIAKEIVSWVSDAVEWFSNLSEGNKKLILVIAGVIAIAPAVISAIQGIAGALAFLAANPIVAVIAALAALGVAIAVAAKKARDARFEELEEDFQSLQEETGILTEDLYNLDQAIESTFFAGSFDDTVHSVRTLAEQLQLSEAAVIEVALQNENIDDITKEQLKTLQEHVEEWEHIAGFSTQAAINEATMLKDSLRQQEALERIAAAQADREEITNNLRDDQVESLKLWEEMQEAIRILNEKEEAGLITVEEKTEAIIELNKDWINSILELGFSIDDPRIVNALQRIKDLSAETTAELTATSRNLQGVGDTAEEAAKQTEETWLQAFDRIKNNVQTVGSQIKGIFTELNDFQSQALENRQTEEENAIKNSMLTEEEKAAALKALAEDVAAEKRALARKEAIGNKAIALFDIGVNTAVAITKALPNLILAGIIGVLGGVQAAIVAAKPLPALKEGAVINPTNGGTQAIIGEGGIPEAVIPLSQDVLAGIGAGIARATQISNITNTTNNYGSREVTAKIDSRVLFKIVDDGYINGQMPQMAKAIG